MKSIPVLVILFCLAIPLTACLTVSLLPPGDIPETNREEEPRTAHLMPTDLNQLILNTYPDGKIFRFAALSPRFQSESDEELYALGNAARQMSIYRGSRVRYAQVMDENIIGTVREKKVEILYDRDLAQSFLDKFKVLDVIRDQDSFMALLSLETEMEETIPQVELFPGERPSWVNNPPESGDYIFGVGIGGRRKTVYESWINADNQAMAEIASTVETKIFSGITNLERSSSSYHESATSVKTTNWSDVYLEGILIVSRWRENDSSNYYSLAVMRKL